MRVARRRTLWQPAAARGPSLPLRAHRSTARQSFRVTDTVNTIQGVRSYDPAMGAWTTPDAYAGDASDPMSRKSYMWNRNNAFAYSDPTGYYICPDCSDAQNQQLDSDAAASRALVAQRMASIKNKQDSALYARLKSLLDDLTKGTGTWVISPRSLAKGIQGQTSVLNYPNGFTTASGTTIDFQQLDAYGPGAAISTLVTEGGKFDMATGRAGPALHRLMRTATHIDFMNGNQVQNDRLVNLNYNIPLHVQTDWAGP